MPGRTHEAVQQKTPLTMVTGNNVHLSPTVCHSSSSQHSSDVRTVVPTENMAYPSPIPPLGCS